MPTATRHRAPARRGHGERLREEILGATRHLLELNGDASAITLRGVAREVGVTPTSIYLHFDDVDALISVVKQQLFTELSDAMEAAVPDGADPVAVVRASSRGYVGFAFGNAGLYGALFTSRHVAPPHLSGETFLGEQTLRQTQAKVAAAIGTDVHDPEAAMVTMHLWTSLHGIVTLRTLKGNFPWPDLDDQVDDLVDRLFPAGSP